jgi:hypothetical protein
MSKSTDLLRRHGLARAPVYPIIALTLAVGALAACDVVTPSANETPIEVAGWPAVLPNGWTRATDDGDGLIRLERRLDGDLVGVILTKRIDRGGDAALDRLIDGMRALGYEISSSADRRERTEDQQHTLLQPVVLSAGGQRMVGIVGVHERGGQALSSMFWVADEAALEDLVAGYDRFVASLGAQPAQRSPASTEQRCRTVSSTRMVPQYGACIGAYCTPTWNVSVQPVTRQICQ